MQFEVTKRDMLILAIFALVLVIGCYAYVRHVTAPRHKAKAVTEEASTERTPSLEASRKSIALHTDAKKSKRSEGALSVSSKPAKMTDDHDYDIIWKRNIFKPALPTPATKNTAEPTEVSPPAPVEPLPPPPPLTPQKPKEFAYTAFISVGDEKLALIENVNTHEGHYVREGDTVFDFRVVSISPDAVELERDGTIFQYTIGENKEARKLKAPTAKKQQPGAKQQQTQQQQSQQQGGQPSAQGQEAPPPPGPPSRFERRRQFFERVMQRIRARYGDNIPPEIRARIERFRRRMREREF